LSVDSLDGDLAAAKARLRGLAEEACFFLDAEALNVLNMVTANSLDYKLRERMAKFNSDLDGEHSELDAWVRRLAKREEGGVTSIAKPARKGTGE
jgi:hypothetical protein